MSFLLAFLPFVVFALLDRLIDPVAGLAAAALVSLVLICRDLFVTHRTPKILEVGSAVLFSALTLYVIIAKPELSIMAVRLMVDGGLLLLILLSIAIGMPFTLQYAKDTVPSDKWSLPSFRRTNVIISAAWAIAMAVIVIVDAVLLSSDTASLHTGTLVIIAALFAAFKFTQWYPKQLRHPEQKAP